MVCLISHRTLCTVRKQALRLGRQNNPSTTTRKLTTSEPDIIELDPNHSEQGIQIRLADAMRPYHENQTPVVIRRAYMYANSIACQKWHDVEYLRQAIGDEKECEVEIGTLYTDAIKSRIPFGQYCDYLNLAAAESQQNDGVDEIDNSSSLSSSSSSLPMVYLAQNEVFDGLRDDYDVPKFCSDAALNVGQGSLYNEMVWIGPQGCVSPLHYDPLDNIFLQFAGVKRISLYPPQEESTNECYYPGYNGGQYNTSGVDVEQPDFGAFPLFRNVAPLVQQVVVRSGDLLFIPAKWWHHVRSLEYSVSVNVFWR